MSSIGQFNVGPDLIGAKDETPAASDTSTSGLNGLTKRGLQSLTALIAKFPTIGQKANATSLAVALATDDPLTVAVGSKTDAKSTATDTTAVSGISLWKQISAYLSTLSTKGQGLKSGSLPVTLASDDDLLGRIGEVQASPTSNTVLDRLKAIYTVLNAGFSFASQGFGAAVSVTRTADTNAYSSGDVIGAATGSTAALTFTNMAPSGGGEVMITSASLEIDAGAIISGETAYELKLYSVTPPSALGDNVAWDLPPGDRASYLGKIALGVPVDLGSTLFIETDAINKQITLAGTSLFAYLVTVSNYTPTSARVYKVTLHTARV